MRKPALVLSVVIVALLAAVRPEAQVQAASVAVVDSQWLIMQHPGGALAQELQLQARQELLPIVQELDALHARASAGDALSPDQAERFEVLRVTLEHAQATWIGEIDAAAAPAIVAVDEAIAAVAQRHAFSVVFDATASSPSGAGLIVYVDQSVDITETVLAEMHERPSQ